MGPGSPLAPGNPEFPSIPGRPSCPGGPTKKVIKHSSNIIEMLQKMYSLLFKQIIQYCIPTVIPVSPLDPREPWRPLKPGEPGLPGAPLIPGERALKIFYEKSISMIHLRFKILWWDHNFESSSCLR